MDDAQHADLAKRLHAIEGMAVLSGYPSELYADLYHDWHREEIDSLSDGARPRTEVLWINPAAMAQLKRDRDSLFEKKP